LAVDSDASRAQALAGGDGVDRGQFALPGAPPRLHVEKVVIEALVIGGVGLRAVRAAPEEPQRGQRALDHCAA